MSQVYAIADEYVDRWAALDPTSATAAGVTGHDAAMTDYSPAGIEARAALDRSTLARLQAASIRNDRDRIARDVMVDSLQLTLDQIAAGDHRRDLNVIHCPVQEVRSCFDLMAKDSAADWEIVAERLSRVPAALAGYQATLREGLARGQVAARRQALESAAQAGVWSGEQTGRSFFADLVAAYGGSTDDLLGRRLADAAQAAAMAYADLRRFLREEYAPRAPERDAVGRERYARAVRRFNGLDLDLDETYAWGWTELARLEAEMRATAEKILPGGDPAAVRDLLDTDPARSIEGVEPYRAWMQEVQDRTIAALNSVHFDIPEPIRRVEAMIPPPGGPLAMYYTGPAEDFSRPGRIWAPIGDRTRFPLWGDLSTMYHEGVPGHHLQVAQHTYLAGELSRFQRLLAWSSGYGEGWALYAERLMAELGYLENPDFYLGFLSSQAMRAARVVVDIGLHLELTIPADERYHPGAVWTPELALEFMIERALIPRPLATSEISRYLGWPGQAISYKVGERIWLTARATVKERLGADFNLKAFHARALNLGPMGLDRLRQELTSA